VRLAHLREAVLAEVLHRPAGRVLRRRTWP
jgi:hypothetical protein